MDKSFKAAVAFYKPVANITHRQVVMRLYRRWVCCMGRNIFCIRSFLRNYHPRTYIIFAERYQRILFLSEAFRLTIVIFHFVFHSSLVRLLIVVVFAISQAGSKVETFSTKRPAKSGPSSTSINRSQQVNTYLPS